ncbi:MAG: SH3 domain-containing protein [Clostridia bacterium]
MNFKKLVTGILVSCFSFSLPFSAFAQSGTVSANVLNVRSSSSTASEILATVSNGEVVELLNFDGSWYKVQLSNGVMGYVLSDYIVPGPVYYGVVYASSLMVRSEPNANADIIAKFTNGTTIELLALEGEWYKIRISDTQYGYVCAAYVATSTPPVASATDSSYATETQEVTSDAVDPTQPYTIYGYVDASALNIRKSTGISTDIIAKVPCGTQLELLAYDGSWYRVKLSDGSIGYASADYISLEPVSSATAHSKSAVLGQEIVQTAYQYLGTPYVYATSGPSSFDCSGFTMYVMAMHGIDLPHHSASQYNYGISVEKENLIAGDLVFFNSNSRSGVAHVGIYISDGKFIHASSGSAASVTISSLSDNYYTTHYLGARRVI